MEVNAIVFTEIGELGFQLPIRDVHKKLVVGTTHPTFILKVVIIAEHQRSDVMFQTIGNDHAARFGQVVVHTIIAFLCKSRLLVCDSFHLLLVLDALQSSIALVVPLINRLQALSINDKGVSF